MTNQKSGNEIKFELFLLWSQIHINSATVSPMCLPLILFVQNFLFNSDVIVRECKNQPC